MSRAMVPLVAQYRTTAEGWKLARGTWAGVHGAGQGRPHHCQGYGVEEPGDPPLQLAGHVLRGLGQTVAWWWPLKARGEIKDNVTRDPDI